MRKTKYLIKLVDQKFKYSFSAKFFGSKYKTVVKELNKEDVNDYGEKNGKISNKENKEDFNYKNEIFNKERIFTRDYREAVIDLVESKPKFMYLYYTAHLIPGVLLFQNLYSITWVYQLFWVGASTGLNFCAYEYYSDENEQKILNNHINYCIILSGFTIFFAVLYSQSKNKPQSKILYQMFNILNFFLIYRLNSAKKREFFIPSWIKYSQRKFFSVLILLSSFSLLISIDNKDKIYQTSFATDEDVLLTHHRYLREMSRIISEISNENPNVDYIKTQLRENEIGFEEKMKRRVNNIFK